MTETAAYVKFNFCRCLTSHGKLPIREVPIPGCFPISFASNHACSPLSVSACGTAAWRYTQAWVYYLSGKRVPAPILSSTEPSLRCSHWEKTPTLCEACPVLGDGRWECPCWKMLSSDPGPWTESFWLCMVFLCTTEAAYEALHNILTAVLTQFRPLCVLCTKTWVTQRQPVLTWARSFIHTVELQVCCFTFYCGVEVFL